MDEFEFLEKYLRTDIPGIFNEASILKNYRERFEQVLDKGIILPPYEVIIHPCSYCNLRCKWCIGADISRKKKKTEKVFQRLPSVLEDPKKMERLIRNLLSYEKKTVEEKNERKIEKIYKIEKFSFSGLVGEPLLAKEAIIGAIDILTEKKKRVGIYTNGTLIDDELIEALIKISYINISIDAGSSSTYSKLKYQSNKKVGEKLFENLLSNIKKLVRKRNASSESNLEINASYVLYPNNYKEIYKTAKLLKQIGIENLKIKQDNSGHNLLSRKQMVEANRLLDKVNFLVDNKFNFIRIHILNSSSEMKRTAEKCRITDLMGAVGSDGKVYPCNYHPRHSGFSYGNAIENKFQEIWEGEKRRKIKERLPEICPEVCDPFKNRANRLFEAIKKYQEEYGKKKTEKLVNKIIENIKPK
jgi:radical SAM protein with 4Fe4S-binding SPASM domain